MMDNLLRNFLLQICIVCWCSSKKIVVLLTKQTKYLWLVAVVVDGDIGISG